MRLALLLLVPALVSAAPINPITFRLDTSSTNLTSTFPVIPQLSGFSTAIANVDINNGTGVEIEVNCSASTQPSSNSGHGIYVPGGVPYSSPFTAAVQLPFGKYCWLRTVSGTASSGIVEVVGWGY